MNRRKLHCPRITKKKSKNTARIRKLPLKNIKNTKSVFQSTFNLLGQEDILLKGAGAGTGTGT